MKRRFAIPVMALGAGATACTEAIEGSWDITQAAGETLPYVYAYGGSTYTIQSTLNIIDERVSLNTIYHYLYDDDTFVDSSASVSGTLESKSSRRSYGITFEGILNGDDASGTAECRPRTSCAAPTRTASPGRPNAGRFW